MSRKHVIKINLFDGVSADMSGNLTSKVIKVSELDSLSIHATWAAGPAGEFRVESRNYNEGPLADDWSVLSTGTAWTFLAADAEATIVLTSLPFIELRFQYIRTSGTGTLTAFVAGKTLGA